MRIVGRDILAKFGWRHAAARKSLARWLEQVEAAAWTGPADVKRQFAQASFLSGNRVVFNLGGDRSRLLVVAVYVRGLLDIRWVGTHAEYDKLNL
jgi:mRNA interferase HigB